MPFVSAQFVLPTVTSPAGAVMTLAPRPGRCPTTIKRRVQYSRGTRSNVIRMAAPRRQLVYQPDMGGFFDIVGKVINGAKNVVKGATEGFAVAGPVGAFAGGAAGAAESASGGKGKGQAQVQAAPQQQLGPLATVSTTSLVIGGMAFSALILAFVASRGR